MASIQSGFTPEPSLAAGEKIEGRYQLIHLLGAGGCGSVWAATHLALARQVALKFIHRHALTAPMLARFQREGRAAASIDHPNVVRVLDYGVDPIFGPYLVMELLRGQSLGRVMRPHASMELRDVVTWLGPVASALEALHASGLVHRDVKPENIVRAHGIVKLVDFGLAAYADGRDRITDRALVVGTPHYLAPEVIEGDSASSKSDIYSLAVVAFELLTGSYPHDGDTPISLVRAKISTPPASLSGRTGRLFAIGLERLFEEALSPDPRRRPVRATEVIDRLGWCLRRA